MSLLHNQKVPKDIRLNSAYFYIMKIPNKRELQKIALNHSSDIDFKDFMKIYKKCTLEPYSFLVNGTTLPSDNPLRFRKNLLKQIYNKIMIIDHQINPYLAGVSLNWHSLFSIFSKNYFD